MRSRIPSSNHRQGDRREEGKPRPHIPELLHLCATINGGECKRFDRPCIQNHRPSWRGGTTGGQVRQGHDSQGENGIGF